ncbi:uncharacterized protein LOC125425415, partial [Sphaerodactylus townsendi]|uniref:uncharacterized protein LOC125425415 n=1 Tax=Sphaerodactylus townsendi TaxID=933632 RepID=UPI00202722F4
MPPDTEETELLLLVVTLLCHWTRVVSAAQAFMHATDVHDSLPQASALSPVSGRRARGSRRWVALAAAPTPRRFWVYPHRSRDWWYNCVWSSWNDEEWLKNFRMSRGTFQRIVDSLAPALRRQDTRMRAALPVEMRVGMAIWYLASPNSFREVRQQFGVGTTTAFEAVHEFCEAVKNILFKRVVRFADPVEKVMRGFANIGFPQCVGAIDGCHIQILNPSDAHADYINRKRAALPRRLCGLVGPSPSRNSITLSNSEHLRVDMSSSRGVNWSEEEVEAMILSVISRGVAPNLVGSGKAPNRKIYSGLSKAM